MTDQHPITPSPELVQQWCLHSNKHETADQFWRHIATQAAQWGADMELEACIQLLDINGCPDKWIDMLRAARRPKPPSLKARALDALAALEINEPGYEGTYDAIRRALEALPE